MINFVCFVCCFSVCFVLFCIVFLFVCWVVGLFVCLFVCLFFTYCIIANMTSCTSIVLTRFQELCGTAKQRPRETVIPIVQTSATTRYLHTSAPKSSCPTYSSSFFSFRRAVAVAVPDRLSQTQKLETSYPQAATAI